MSYRSGGYTSSRLGAGAGSSYSSKYSTGSAAARSSSAGASSYSASKYDSGNSYTSRYSSSKNDSKTGGSYTSKYSSGSAALGKDSADTYTSKYRRDSSTGGAADAYGSTRRTSADTSSSKYLDTDSFASKYRRGSDTLAPDTDYSSRYRRGSDVRAADEDSYASKYRRGSDPKTTDTDTYASKYGRDSGDRYSSRYDAKGDSTDKYTSKYRSSLEPESRTSRYDTKAGDTESYASKYRRDSGDRPSSRYSDLKADTDYASRYRSASPSRTETKASDAYSSRYRRDSADRTDSRLSTADSHSSRYGADSRLSNRSADDGSDRPSSRYGSRLDDRDAYKSSYRRSSIEPDGRTGRTSPYTTLDDRHRSGRASPYLGDTLPPPYRRGSREGSASDYLDRRRSSRDTSPFNRDHDNASPFGRDRDRETYRSRYSAEPPDKTADIIAKYKNAKDDLTAEIDTMIKQNRRKEMEKEMSQWQQKTADLLTEKPKPKEPRTRSGSRPKSRASDSDDSKRKKIVRRRPRASSEDIEPVTTKFKVKDDLGDEIDALIRQNRRKAIEDDIQYKLSAMEDAVKPGTTTVKKHSDKRRSHSPRHADHDYDEPFKRRGRRTALDDDDEPSGSRRRRHDYDDEADVDEPRTLLRSASKADDAFDEIGALREKRRKAIQDALKSSEEVFTDTKPSAVEKRRSLSREPTQAADKGFAKLDAQKQKRRKALEEALRDSEQAFDQATDSVARQLSDARRSAEPTKKVRYADDASQKPARSASQSTVPRKTAELANEEGDRPKRFSRDSLKKSDARRRPEPEEPTKEDFRAAADRLKRVKAGSARQEMDEPSNEYLSHLKKVETGSKHMPYSTATDAYAVDETVPLQKKSPVDVNIPERRGKTQLEKYERYSSSESDEETPSRRAAPKDDAFDEIEALRQKRRKAIEDALRESADVFDKTAEAAVKKPSDARRSASPAKRVQSKPDDTPQRSASQAAVPRKPVEQKDTEKPSRVDGTSHDNFKDATERLRHTDAEARDTPKASVTGSSSGLKKVYPDKKEAPFSAATDSYAVNETLSLPSKAPLEAKIPEKRGNTELELYDSYESYESEDDEFAPSRVKPKEDAVKNTYDARRSESPAKKDQSTYDDISATQAESPRTPTGTSRRDGHGTSASDGAPHDDFKGAAGRLRRTDLKSEGPTEESQPDYPSRLRKTDYDDKEVPFSTATDAFAVNETVSLPSKKPFEATIPEKRGKTQLEQYERYSSPKSDVDDAPQSRVKPNEDAGKKSSDARRSESPAKKAQQTYDDVKANQAAPPRTPTRTSRRDVDGTSVNDSALHGNLKDAAERLRHTGLKSEMPTGDSHSDYPSRLRKTDLDDEREPFNTETDAYSVNETVSLPSKKPVEASIPETQEKTRLDRYKRFSSSESDEEPPRRSAPPKDDGFDEIEALRQKRRKAIEEALRASEEVFDKTADVAVKKPSDTRRSASPAKKMQQSGGESPSVPQRSASQAAVPRKPLDASQSDNGRPSRIDSTPAKAVDGKKDAVSGIAAQDDFKSAADRLKQVDAKGRSVDDEPTQDYPSQLKKTDVGKKDTPPTIATDDYAVNAAFSAPKEPTDVNLPGKRDKTRLESYEKSPASATAKPTTTTEAEPDAAKAASGLVKEIGPDGKTRWVKAGQPSAVAQPKAGETTKAPARSASQAAAPRKPAETPSTPGATAARSASVTPKPTVPPKMTSNEPRKPEKSTAEPQVSSAQKTRPASPKKTSTDKPHKEPVTGSRIKGIDQDQRDRHGPSHLAYDSEIGPYGGKQRSDASAPDAVRGPPAVTDLDADGDAEFTFQPRSGDNVVSPRTAPKQAVAETSPIRAKASEQVADEGADFTYRPTMADKSRSSSPTKMPAEKEGTESAGTRSPTKDPLKPQQPRPSLDEEVEFSFAPKDGKTPSGSNVQADREKAQDKDTQLEARRGENAAITSKPKPAEQAKARSPSPAKRTSTAATQPSKSQDSVKAEAPRTPVKVTSDASVTDDEAEFTFKPTTAGAAKPHSPSPSKKPISAATQPRMTDDTTKPGATTPLKAEPYATADNDAEYSIQQKDDAKNVPPAAAPKQSLQQQKEAPRDSLRKVEGKPKDSAQPTTTDEYAVLRKPPIEVHIPDKRDKTQLEKFEKSPYEQSKAGKPVQEAGKQSRDRSADAAPKAAGGLVKEIGPDGKTRWVKAGAQPPKDAKPSAGQPGATPRSASAAAGPRRQLSDEELEADEISDPHRSREPAKHDIRFVPPGDKQKTEPQVSVAATGKPRTDSPQKTPGGDKPEREPRTGSRIKGINQDQRDRHGPDHLSYDSEIGPYAGKKDAPEGRKPTTDGSVPMEGPLVAKPGEPVADEDADFTFKPKAHDVTAPPRTVATPKDGEKAPLKAKPEEATTDENADFTFAPKADDKAKPRSSTSSEKPQSATAPLRAMLGDAIADEDADFAYKPRAADKPKSRSSSPSKKSRPITPRIVIDEPEDEMDADYIGDLQKPVDARPNDSKSMSQPTRPKQPTSSYDEDEQEPESLDDADTPARKHDLSFKSKPSDTPIETGKGDNAPERIAKSGEPAADKDADFTFKPSLAGKPTSKAAPAGATKQVDSDEELEPELMDDASGGQKKPPHYVKFKPEATKPDDEKKAPTKVQPEKPLADKDVDFTFKPKDEGKKAPPQTPPKASKHAVSDANDAFDKSPKATPGEAVPDEDADFTFKPKPVDKPKAHVPSVAKKPSDAEGQPDGAKGKSSETPLKPKPGDAVPDDDAEYTFQPKKSADKARTRSPSPSKKPTETAVQQPQSPDTANQTKTPLKAKPGDAVPDEDADFTFKPKQEDVTKPGPISPSKKSVASSGKPQAIIKDSDEELEPELLDESPQVKAPAHDVKFKPAEAKKPADEGRAPSKTALPTAETPMGDAKVADKAKPRSPSPAKKPVATSGQPKAAVSLKPADSDEELEPELVDSGPIGKKPDHDVKLKPAESKKPAGNEQVSPKTADKPAGTAGVSPQAGVPTANARPTPEGNVPDEDAEFTFKPKAAGKAKPRSPSPTKKLVSPKAAGKRPRDSDEELEPELIDEGPVGKVPEHDVKLRPAEVKKPMDDAKTPPKTAAKPAEKKPDETPQGANKSAGHPRPGDTVPDEDADFTFKPKPVGKSKPRSPSPAKQPTKTSEPSETSSMKPSSDDELEPELIDAGPDRAKPSHDIKLKKPIDDVREAPTPMPKSSERKPIETQQDAKRPVVQPEAEDAVPDEDADFTFKPKPAGKSKPRSPSPAKKLPAAPAEAKKPADDTKVPPTTAPKPGVAVGETPRGDKDIAEPGGVIPDKDADFTFQPKPADKTKPRSPSPAKKPSAEAKKPTDDTEAPVTAAPKPGVIPKGDKAKAPPLPGGVIPDEDADFTFQPKPVDKSKPRSPSPAKKPSAAPAEAKKPTRDAKAPATEGSKPGEIPQGDKAKATPQPRGVIPDQDVDVTFKPKPADKSKSRSPSPAKKPSAAPAEAKKPIDDTKVPPFMASKPGGTPTDVMDKAEPRRVVPDEDADFTFQPKPVGKSKPRSPSPAKKPSVAQAEAKKPADDTKAPPVTASKPGVKSDKTPRGENDATEPGRVVPDEDADFTFQPKPADKLKARTPSPSKKPTGASTDAKTPTGDAMAPATAGSKPGEIPPGEKVKAPPLPGGVIPDEDADFTFKPKPVDTPKTRSTSPAKKPTPSIGLAKPNDKIPTGSDEELEPEQLDDGPIGKKPAHDVKYKPADSSKPAEAEKPVLKPVPKPVTVAKEPAKAAPSEKPKDNDTMSVLDKLPERRMKTPLEKLEKLGDTPKQVDAKKPAEVETPAEPKKTGGLVKEIGPDGKTRWVKPTPEPKSEAKKEPDEAKAPAKTAPGTAPKPSAKSGDASKSEPQKAPLKAKPGDAAPDEDADFTFKPKPADKLKPRSPSPAKKPAASATQSAKPQDDAKPDPTHAPMKAKPGSDVPDKGADFTFKPKPADNTKQASGKPAGTDEELEPDLMDGPGQKPPHDVKFKPAENKKPVEDAKHAPKTSPKPAAAKPGETAKAPSQAKPGAAAPDEDADFTFKPKPKAAAKKPVGSDEEMEPDLMDGPSGQKPPHDVKFKPSDAKKPTEEVKVPPKAAPKPVKPSEGVKDEPTKPEEAAEPKKTGGLVKELGPDGKVRWVKPTPEQKDEPAKTADEPGKPNGAAKKAPTKPRDASAEPKVAPNAAPKPGAQPVSGTKEPAKTPLKLKPGEPDNDQDADATVPLKPASAKPAVGAPAKQPAKQEPDKQKDAAKPAAQKPRDSATDPKAASKAAPKPATKPATASKEPLKPKAGEPTTDENADATLPLKPSGEKPVAATAKPTAPKAAAKPGEAPKPPSEEAPKAATKPGDAAKAAPKPAEAPKAKTGEPQKALPKPAEGPKATPKPGEAPKTQPAAAPKAGAKPGDAPKAAPKPAEAPKAAVAKPGEALKPTAKPGETPKAQPAAVPKPAAKPAEAPKPSLKPVVAPAAAGPAKSDGPQKEEEKPSVLDKLPERGKKTPLEKYVPFKPPEEKPSVLDSLPEKMQKTPLEKYVPLGGPEAAKQDGKPKYDPLKYLPEKKLEAVPKKTGGLIKEIGPDGKVKWVKPPPEPKPEPPPKKAAPRKVTVIPEEPVEDVDAEANLPLGKKDGKKPADKDKEAKPDDKDDPKKGTKRKPGEDKGKGDEEPQKSDEDVEDEEEESGDEDMEVDGAKPKKGRKKAKKTKKGGDDESDDDESDEDEESDADDSDGPHRKKAKKKPKKGKKSKKKGDNEDSEPSDEDADYTFKPKRKKKKPADEDGSDDDEDRPSKRRKKRKLKKKKPKKEKKEKAPKEPPPKRRWVPPPRQVEEVVAPPPDEKRLCDILREEKINPIKHYAKKPNHIETAIPFVIPWEQSAALVTQEGMGAFGTPRHNAIHIDDGHVELKQGALKSDTVLPLWEDHYRHSETQKGMTSFGSHKKNVGNVIDHHKYESDTKLNLCEGVIPRHALGSLATQHDMTPIGALRTQKMNVKYKENMTEGFDKKGNAFLSRQMQPNSTEHAGSHIMDRRRGVVPATEGKEIKMTHERASDGIIPLLFTTDFIDKRSGADFGSFRPTVHEDEGGYQMTFDDEIRCKAVIPFQTAPGLINGRY